MITKIWDKEGTPIKYKPEYKIKNNIDMEFNSNEEIINNCPQLKNIKILDNMEFCFNYALGIKFRSLDCIEDSVEILFNTYKRVKFKDIQKGDVVLFKDEYDYLHFAIVVKKEDNIMNTIIRAKFGQLGIYEHKLEDTPICYGNIVSFYRKN